VNNNDEPIIEISTWIRFGVEELKVEKGKQHSREMITSLWIVLFLDS